MTGHIIGRGINVNFAGNSNQDCIYFLTHIDNEITEKILPDYVDHLYTSEMNVWILIHHFQVNPERLKILQRGSEISFQNYKVGVEFTVSTIDILDRPGAVMLFFRGNEFGNVLYVGKGSLSTAMFYHNDLKAVLSNKALDVLYVDSEALRHEQKVPNVETALLSVVNLFKLCKNYRVFIILEDMLNLSIILKIRVHFEENIYVNTKTFELLNAFKYSEGFTNNMDARIHLVNQYEIHDLGQWKSYRNDLARTFVFLSSNWGSVHDHTFIANDLKATEMHTYMYRNYNSAEELRLTLQEFRPECVIPLVESDKTFLKEFLSEQYLEVLDDSDCPHVQYWNHISGLDKIFQNHSFTTNHTKLKKSIPEFQLSGTELLIPKNYLVNKFKLRPCSVVIKKLSSKEIEKYHYKHYSTTSVNCLENVSEVTSADEQLEDETKIDGTHEHRYFDETKTESDSSYEYKNSFSKPMSDSNESTVDHNIRRELKVRLVDILKESDFLKQFNLIPKWKCKSNGIDKV